MDLKTSKLIYEAIEANHDAYMEKRARRDAAKCGDNKARAFDLWLAQEVNSAWSLEIAGSTIADHRYGLYMINNHKAIRNDDVSMVPAALLSHISRIYVPASEPKSQIGINFVEAVDKRYKSTGHRLVIDVQAELIDAFRNKTHDVSATAVEQLAKTLSIQMKRRRWSGVKPTVAKFLDERRVNAQQMQTIAVERPTIAGGSAVRQKQERSVGSNGASAGAMAAMAEEIAGLKQRIAALEHRQTLEERIDVLERRFGYGH